MATHKRQPKRNPENFQHNAFQIQMEEILFEYAVDEEAEGRILRAWELAQAMMEVHACVDRLDGQTHEASLQHSWFDLWAAFAGKDATYMYWGLYEEIQHSCRPADSDDLDAQITELGERCFGRKKAVATMPKKSAKKSGSKKKAGKKGSQLRATRAPHLHLVD